MNDKFPLSEGEDAHLLHFAQTAFIHDKPCRIGIAVSGGSDSMAVLHLFARAAPHRGCTVHAVTVNHGLRPEAADEAAFVARACAGLGVSHDTVLWEHDHITGNLQDQARRARYRLIASWAKANKITHVALGHTADDQAETFLMRLAREAGVDGLSGMRHRFDHEGVRFGRPYLFHSRVDLRAYLTRNDVVWIDDPSNDEDRFDRIKARKALAWLKPLGITAQTLSGVASHMHSARQALNHHCNDVARTITARAVGDVVFDWRGLNTQTPEVKRRLLVGALRWISGSEYAPRSEKIMTLENAILNRRDKTLAGCRIVTSDTQVRLFREARAVRDLTCPTDQPWDGRWQLDGPHADDLQIRALGAEGLRDCPDWRATGRPRASLLASPAIWRGGTLVSAPIAGYGNGWQAKIDPNRGDFAASLIGR